jgi:hypothetical protein
LLITLAEELVPLIQDRFLDYVEGFRTSVAYAKKQVKQRLVQ